MSILEELEDAIARGEFEDVQPPKATIPRVRRFVIHKGIVAAMRGEHLLPLGRWQAVYSDLVHFVRGTLVIEDIHIKTFPVAGRPCTEFKSYQEVPEVRLFGRFAAPGVFVATNWSPRDTLKGVESGQWEVQADVSDQIWDQNFTSAGYVGGSFHERVTGNTRSREESDAMRRRSRR